MNFQEILSRLDGVRDCGNGGFIAKCPSHDDKSPSMTVKLDGDRVLIHCFAGCEPTEIVHALGMHWTDFFEGSIPQERTKRHRWPASLLLTALAEDTRWMMYATHQMYRGETLKPEELKRLEQIHVRLLAAQELAGFNSKGKAA